MIHRTSERCVDFTTVQQTINVKLRAGADLLQVLHHEGELLHVSLVALLPGLLLFAAGVPAQTLDDVMLHRRATVVFRRLPAQSDGVLCHQVDLQLGRGVGRV